MVNHAPYGFGWYIAQHDHQTVAYHGGTLAGYTHFFARYLDEDFSSILLSNNATFQTHRAELIRDLSEQQGIVHEVQTE